MGTIADKIKTLKQTKNAIKQSIINRGVEILETDKFEIYPEKIAEIGGLGPNYEPSLLTREFKENTIFKIPDDITTTGKYFLNKCLNIIELNLNNVTTVNGPFCQKSWDLRKINGPKVTTATFSYLSPYAPPTLNPSSIFSVGSDFKYVGWSKKELLNKLTEINLPSLVLTEKCEYIFNNCQVLTVLNLKDFGTVIPSYGFSNCFKLDISKFDLSKIIKINRNAFSIDTNINGWDFSNDKEVFPDKEPYTINLPSIEKIEYSAFSGRKYLQNIVLGPNLSFIDANVFTNCSSLESIHIGSSITTIGGIYNYEVFNGCTALKTITIDKPQDSIAGAPWGAPNAQVIWNG